MQPHMQQPPVASLIYDGVVLRESKASSSSDVALTPQVIQSYSCIGMEIKWNGQSSDTLRGCSAEGD
jgi:hypothetical protein